MLNAFGLGAVSQLSLILSGVVVFLVSVPTRVVGALAAFGAGALIAAIARDLLPETHPLQLAQASLWAMVGAAAFIAWERYVDKKVRIRRRCWCAAYRGRRGGRWRSRIDHFRWRAAIPSASLSSPPSSYRTFRRPSHHLLTWLQRAGTGGELLDYGPGLCSHAA